MPKVYNKRDKNRPDDCIYVGRGSPWGNPFIIGKDGNRDEVCDLFEKKILPTLDLTNLEGKNLVCWCKPARCHADSLLKAANKKENKC